MKSREQKEEWLTEKLESSEDPLIVPWDTFNNPDKTIWSDLLLKEKDKSPETPEEESKTPLDVLQKNQLPEDQNSTRVITREK